MRYLYMMNVIVNIKSSECGKTGFIAHICRNELLYGIGTVSTIALQLIATWYFYCRKSQDLRNAIFSKLNLNNTDFIILLNNINPTGIEKKVKKFY